MSTSQIETTKGLCSVALTKFLMNKLGLKQDEAYARLMQTELFPLLMDTETNLYLETNDYLCECCEEELNNGKNALYEFINR